MTIPATSVSSRLTIFEGPDGSGKTTAAQDFAKRTGAKYVHFSNLPRISKSLARMYVEAMLPALMGYQDVVFDRCWLSEEPYGVVFRDGRLRLSVSDIKMLERLAMRCGTVVVRCDPGWESVKASYLSRRHLEMLENEDQLSAVHSIYTRIESDLPMIVYDYKNTVLGGEIIPEKLDVFRSPPHPLKVASAGHWWADTILVGEAFGERKEYDSWYQAPFVSFSGYGCSRWLTEKIVFAGLSERNFLWLNADQDLSIIGTHLSLRNIIALGDKAHTALKEAGIKDAQVAPHPQFWKRFNSSEPYPLIDLLIGVHIK